MKYRPEIDGLRAAAVLPVLAFHAFPDFVAGGFVGVDVFFVISGYLITSILAREIEAGTFSLKAFYARRIRRIFPALALVLLACLAAGWLILDRSAYLQLGTSTVASAGFAANLLLWRQAGYFDTASETKPLLHLWSLGIEEQFYFVLPLALGWLRARRRPILAALVLSFSYCLWLSYRDSAAAFYSPASRAWELLLGSAAALYAPRLPRWGGTVGLALIGVSVVILSPARAFPGAWALLPTLGALAVVVSPPGALLSSVPMVAIGRVSYPLYLWHWPLLTFTRIVYRGSPPAWALCAAIGLSFALATLTYKLLEQRVQRTRSPAPRWAMAVAAVAALAIGVRQSGGAPRRAAAHSEAAQQLEPWAHVSNDACLKRFGKREVPGWWFCNLSRPAEPTLAVLGNSHANHIYPGLVEELPQHTLLSLGSCEPVLGVHLATPSRAANPCRGTLTEEASRFVLEAVKQAHVRHAIIAATWFSFEASGKAVCTVPGCEWWFSAMQDADRGVPPGEVYYRGLSRYVGELEQSGVQLIVALDTPALPYDIALCVGSFAWTNQRDCTVTRQSVDGWRRDSVAMLARLQRDHPNVKVFDPIDAFCDASLCRMIDAAGVPLLRDSNHLSEAGSAAWARAFSRWARTHAPELLQASAAGSP